MRNRSRRTAAVMMALLIAAASFAGCSKKTEETKIQLTRVETQTASRGTLEITGTYIGTVAPHNSVNVTPLVAGTVKQVNVKVGDKVKAGDVLCQFDDKAASLQLQSARDAVNSAQAGKEAAEDQIHAAKKQAEAQITSMEGQVDTLYAQKEASEEQLEQLEASLDDLKKAMEAAQQGYAAAKKIYDSANALYIQYQAFLSANPDCATTAGLMAASMPIPPTVPTVIDPPVTDNALGGATTGAETGNPGTDQAAETAQAAAFIDERPEGYEREVSQGGANVSGGQKQRLAIARAVIKKPKIFLFDDSFSALDMKTDVALRKALAESTAESTKIIVATRVGTILHAQQIIVLDEGRIVGKGTHEELMESCDIYRETAISQLSEAALA